MAEKKRVAREATKSGSGFTEEERAAMRETLRERRSQANTDKAEGERAVLEKIAEMEPSDRVMAERLHAIVKGNAPGLTSRTWYGMPAYSKDGRIVCYFQCAQKFKTRYATFGFSDEAKLDEGHMWATAFALTELTAVEEARIVALLSKTLG